MRNRPEISHEQAMVVIDYVRSELEARGAGAAVAVTDPHGELVALLRTDGCPLASVANAIHKAFTAAREGIESAELGRRSRDEGFPMTSFGDLRYTGWGGGVPITVGGAVIGAVGVSGLPEEDDVILARTAAATVGDRPPQ